MSTPPKITATVEYDGAVMLEAAGVVEWLRFMADYYGSGQHGGSERAQKAARQAIDQIADTLQSSYVDQLSDAVLRKWDR